jgi:proline racemase
MRSFRTIHLVSADARGELGDVIDGDVLPQPGFTLWQQSR